MASALGFFAPEVHVRTFLSRPCAALHGSALPQKKLPQHSSLLHRRLPEPSVLSCPHHAKSHSPLIAQASGASPSTKPNSIVCADCDGNGAVQCSQCKGTGVNAVDSFGGRFKAGQLCWLCRGKREILCGNCNGAGFIGGFMSTFDE